jgi:carbon monoxide dehydrogenase subunit G
MAIELEHTFAVPVPPEQAWDVLLDVARVAPCMPGATVDEVDGDVVTGKIKVKVGPIALTYTGKATFTEKDAATHTVRMEAAGKETRGAGTASATVEAKLDEENGETRVRVHTSLNVTGRPAQFGRGVMAEVGGRLIEKFSANLAEQLGSDSGTPVPAAVDGSAPVSGPAAADGSGAPAGAAAVGDARLSIPIQELNLPARSYNTLKGEGIDTVGQLVARTGDELLAIKNIGERSVEEIEEKLSDIGLKLAGATPVHATAGTGTSALNGSAPTAGPQDRAAVDTGTDDTAGPPAARDDDSDDALDLLGVAAGPVLKRVLPALGGAVVLAWLGIRIRRRGRHRRTN